MDFLMNVADYRTRNQQLAKAIQYVFGHPVEAKEKGKKAREKCKI